MGENRINLSDMQETTFILTSNNSHDRPFKVVQADLIYAWLNSLRDGLFCMILCCLLFFSSQNDLF